MDQGTLVADKIDDGRRFVARFAADGNPVQAAFWGQNEDRMWFLYVASELYDREGPAGAYRAVRASLQKVGETSVSGSEIKVISPNHPIAREVLALMAPHPGRTAISSTTLLSDSVDQAIIYPARAFTFNRANPMTPEEIGQEILRLMSRGPGMLQPSRVTLKDGAAFDGVPFSMDLGSQRSMMVRFVADGEAAPRVVRMDEIASIS